MLLWLESLKRRRLLRLSFLKSKIKNLSNFSCQIRIDEGIPFSWKEVNNKMCWCLCPSINQWVFLLLLFVFSSVLSETYVRKILNKNEVSEMVKDNYCVLKKRQHPIWNIPLCGFYAQFLIWFWLVERLRDYSITKVPERRDGISGISNLIDGSGR